MSDNSVVKYKVNENQEITLSPGIIKRYLVSGNGNVTDQEVMMFLQLCKFQRLNPFLREAYLIKYGDNNPATIVTGRDVFTKRAAKNEHYDGMESGLYVLSESGEVNERRGSFKLPTETIVGAWAKVHRKDWNVPVEVSVSLDEYQGRKKNGEVTQQWATKPGTMLVKVAETQALRKAFPEDFGGLYDEAEMNTQDQLPTDPVEPQDVTETEEDTAFQQRMSELVSKLNQYEKDGHITLEQLRKGADYIKAAPNPQALEKAWERLEESINGKKEPESDQAEEESGQEEAQDEEPQDEEGLF